VCGLLSSDEISQIIGPTFTCWSTAMTLTTQRARRP
jgi:hypothetical protein